MVAQLRTAPTGLDAIVGRSGRRCPWWATIIVFWVTRLTPGDFGFVRSRWTCEAVAVVLGEEYRLGVSRETVRRWLHREGLVYRRPRPVLGPEDPHRAAYVQQALLGPTLPTFWTFNPAYAQLQNEHVWPTAWSDIITGGMAPQAAAEKAFKRAEEIFAKYPI